MRSRRWKKPVPRWCWNIRFSAPLRFACACAVTEAVRISGPTAAPWPAIPPMRLPFRKRCCWVPWPTRCCTSPSAIMYGGRGATSGCGTGPAIMRSMRCCWKRAFLCRTARFSARNTRAEAQTTSIHGLPAFRTALPTGQRSRRRRGTRYPLRRRAVRASAGKRGGRTGLLPPRPAKEKRGAARRRAEPAGESPKAGNAGRKAPFPARCATIRC